MVAVVMRSVQSECHLQLFGPVAEVGVEHEIVVAHLLAVNYVAVAVFREAVVKQLFPTLVILVVAVASGIVESIGPCKRRSEGVSVVELEVVLGVIVGLVVVEMDIAIGVLVLSGIPDDIVKESSRPFASV